MEAFNPPIIAPINEFIVPANVSGGTIALEISPEDPRDHSGGDEAHHDDGKGGHRSKQRGRYRYRFAGRYRELG